MWKILQEMGISDHLTCLLKICMEVKKQQLELDMEQQTGSKSGKQSIKAAYCHPSYVTYIQSTSWEILGWKKHKLESRLLGEISITSDMHMLLLLSHFSQVWFCATPGSPIPGILQARTLEWVAISFSRGSSWPRDPTPFSCIAGRFFTIKPPVEAIYRQIT